MSRHLPCSCRPRRRGLRSLRASWPRRTRATARGTRSCIRFPGITIDPDAISFTAVLSLVCAHLQADTYCRTAAARSAPPAAPGRSRHQPAALPAGPSVQFRQPAQNPGPDATRAASPACGTGSAAASPGGSGGLDGGAMTMATGHATKLPADEVPIALRACPAGGPRVGIGAGRNDRGLAGPITGQ